MTRAVAGIVVLGLLYLVFEWIGTGGAAAAWQPPGYHLLGPQVAFRWTAGSCSKGDQDGCWHALVVSRLGCSAELTVTLRESRGRLAVGEVAQDSTAVAPLSPVELEFDATSPGPLSGSIANATCF